MIERRLMSAAVVTALQGEGLVTGLAHAPDGGGWDGQPNKDGSNFIPYVVVTPNTATMASGPTSDPLGDRQLPYSLSSFGVAAEQCEWMADKARAAAETLKKTTVVLGDRSYKVQQARADVIGGIVRVDQTEPPYFGQMDVVTFWLTPA